MFEVDWSKAPEWAMWHAFDIDGKGWFYENKPTNSNESWEPSTDSDLCVRSGYNLPTGLPFNWEKTLIERPAHTITQPKKHSHYHKPTNGAETIDVYWVLNAWEVDCHAVGHAVKKLLNAGQRGAKPKEQDLREAIDSIQRAIELLK